MTSYKAPSIHSTSFNCPRCGALAQQFWYELAAISMNKDKHPEWFVDDFAERIRDDPDPNFSNEKKEELIEYGKRLNSEDVFIWGEKETYKPDHLRNVHISKCYHCNDVSVWVGTKLVFPKHSTQFEASIDMPDNVRADFNEAASVFSISPRAAAALLRVAIEKLCNEINGKNQPIFKGIGELVKNGLDERIQRALDIVRVTGNDAVHPGQIDLNDTPEDAERLFKLVNLIVERLITIPKEIDAVYDGIAPEKLEAIKKRDEK